MDYSSKIDFIIRGNVNDVDISRDSISLSLLSSFTKDINEILNSLPDNNKDEIIVSIQDGSLKYNILISLVAFNLFTSEIEALNSSRDLSLICDKRSKIFEEWSKRAKSFSDLEFEIIPDGHSGIKINSNSSFIKSDENIWIEGEHYLYGVITDMGGSHKPNIHFSSEDGASYLIDCTKDDIINEKENRIYHAAAIRVLAKQNLLSGELKDVKFASFVEYNPKFDAQHLLQIIEKGRNAWSDVPDHIQWVRNLRTQDE